VALGIRVVSKAQQQAGLADTRVADQHELEHVVILLRCGGRHRARSVGKERRRAETRARATAALAGHVMGTQGWVNPLWILTRARRGERCAPAPSECDGAVCVTVACEHAGHGRRQRRCSVELGVCVLEWRGCSIAFLHLERTKCRKLFSKRRFGLVFLLIARRHRTHFHAECARLFCFSLPAICPLGPSYFSPNANARALVRQPSARRRHVHMHVGDASERQGE